MPTTLPTLIPTVALRDGTQLPALGLGSWTLGQGHRAMAEETAAVQEALALGMGLVDTAEMYGDGRSETFIGQAIAGLPPPFLVSKVLPAHAGDAASIRRACEGSLQRLGVQRLDLYLLHWRTARVRLPEVVDTFEALRAEGRIARWGVSNFDVEDMDALWALPGGQHCLVNQVLYHAGSRGIEFDLLPWCDAHGVNVMAYSPLGSRALLGHPVLARIGARHGVEGTAVALAWAIRSSRVLAIPESGNPGHVRANAAAARLALTAADLAELDAAFPPPRRRQPLDVL